MTFKVAFYPNHSVIQSSTSPLAAVHELLIRHALESWYELREFHALGWSVPRFGNHLCHNLCPVSLPPQVMWLPDTERQLVRQVAPGFQQTSGLKLDAERLREKGIVKLNLRYTKVTNEDVRYCPL